MPETRAEPRFEGQVVAAFPLALLESVRAHDHPGEVLEEEDLALSLPQRLGLTGIMATQIYRYEEAARAGRNVRLDEVVNLIRLILRRPDADAILRDTGERMARWQFQRTPRLWVRALHRGPEALALRTARRAAVRLLRRLHAARRVQAAKPFNIHLSDSLTATLNGAGIGCVLVTGALDEQLQLYTGKPRHVRHTCCVARGDARCEWLLEEA